MRLSTHSLSIVMIISFLSLLNPSRIFGQNDLQTRKIDISNYKWQFRETTDSKFMPATVPGCVHTDLLTSGTIIKDPYYRDNENSLQWVGEQDWEYATLFTVDNETFEFKNLELEFQGLDTYADVYLNDSLILKANNFFRTWKVNCKPYIKKGENRIKIFFISSVKINKQANQTNPIPLADDYAYTRKPSYHYGWDWGPIFITQGIWKPIYLNAWNEARINDIQIVQNSINSKNVNLKAVVEVESSSKIEATISLSIKNEKYSTSKNINLKQGKQLVEFNIDITNPKLWWTRQLGKQNLYTFNASVTVNQQVVSQTSIRTGLRTIKLVQTPDAIGKTFYFELNGVPVFMKGANYIPQDMFLNRITKADYEGVIKQATDANMNMLRVWGGGFYENDIFYDLCDEQGILVWQDFMFACAMYPGDELFFNNAKQEFIDNITRLRNHPSIAIWCGNNENYIGWKDWKWSKRYNDADSAKVWNDYLNLYEKLIPQVLDACAPGVIYWPSSPKHGWGYPVNSDGDVHYWGIWHAQEPFEAFAKTTNIPRFMSEYGFQSCTDFNSIQKFTKPEDWSITSPVMKLHQKHRVGYPVIDKYMDWYFKKPKDFKSYLYVSQVLQAFGIGYGIEIHRRNMPFCMGTLYWQINDCYPVASWSSVDYYDQWKALHYKVKQVYSDILVSPFEENGMLKVYVVNDKLENIKSTLALTLVDFNGKKLWESKRDIAINPNSSRVYFEISTDELKKLGDPKSLVLKAQVLQKQSPLSANLYYFSLPKDLNLKKPHLSIQKTKVDDGYELKISTNYLAKNLYLNFYGIEGFFTENYFDLVPGEIKTIRFITKSSGKIENSTLETITLFDSF